MFFEERKLIPDHCFHEIRFEDLEKDPLNQVRGVYEALALPDFPCVEPDLRKYIDSLTGYTKNVFPVLPPELKSRIGQEWWICFEHWRYPP